MSLLSRQGFLYYFSSYRVKLFRCFALFFFQQALGVNIHHCQQLTMIPTV
jgi:hypothetical protein